ncbi:uncharacterized protein LOC131216652 [Anopheles bellator]|uniref:uncharacterized protein LOC131216652 n=1 Tax=Anopheles bellator TaxID=139047 RepID=UPI0026480041|nr:uncharacterized protein LOC131216652 [Anopheles bellator]
MSKKHEYKQFMLEFIQVYRQLPALWDQKSADYNNRVTKAEQYEVLVEKYRERYPDSTKVDVVQKINSLRTNFRKELKRIRDAERYGGRAVESSQWYFEAISFLDSDASKDGSMSTEHTYCVPEQSEGCKVNLSIAEDVGTLIKIEVEPAKKPRAITMKEEIDSQNDLVEAACEGLHEGPDDNDILAAAWAVELRSMHWQQQLLAKKAINDILFEGQMGTLHRHSVEINATRCDTQSSTPIEHKSTNYDA